ncbi:RBBP9/YdeN family alpha/beta hydrolase [Streptomyces vilmorinianum]|uniref:RBBP9/YdeN family alpha/beta hydrolase n=1 Tax=Streptomyces vilmorinianum TaxID=3051092 RepID=UPI0010FB1642|nr:alpha/beta hydrolase [Streptomyces vilmorinianum]
MTGDAESTIVIVPGMREHVEDHWQTILAERLGHAGRTVRVVPPLVRDRLSRDAQVANVVDVMARITGPVVIVAHSAGVLTTVHWAQCHDADVRGTDVRGALLAVPPDFETPLPDGYPAPDELATHGWTPVPRKPLPFPSIVAASSDDPLGSLGRVAELARDWGSRLVEIGPVGHLNPASGHGPWPQSEALVEALELGWCHTTAPRPAS